MIHHNRSQNQPEILDQTIDNTLYYTFQTPNFGAVGVMKVRSFPDHLFGDASMAAKNDEQL